MAMAMAPGGLLSLPRAAPALEKPSPWLAGFSCGCASPAAAAPSFACVRGGPAWTAAAGSAWERRARCRAGRRSGPGFQDDDGMEAYRDPADVEPPEADDEEEEGLTAFERVTREARRARKREDEKYKGMKPVFMQAIGLDEDGNELGNGARGDEDEEDEEDQRGREIVRVDGDTFSKVKDARRVKPPRGKQARLEVEEDGEGIEEEEEEEVEEEEDLLEVEELDLSRSLRADASFDLELGQGGEEEGEEEVMAEPTYRMSLGELLDEARVTAVSVEGDLDVEVTGIQHDSREVEPGDMFVCCTGLSADGHAFTAQAVERGAIVIVAAREVSVAAGTVKAVVVVEDTNGVLSALAGAFYSHPSRKLSVVGITGTNGKTTTSYLLRSMYESMGMRTGLLGTISYYINARRKLEAPNTTPDAVYLQKLMASMVHYGSEVCVMEVSSHALALGRCTDVDFDVAVFTNLTRDHMDFHGSMEEYRDAKARLFDKMVDPKRHRKVVNIDDPNAGFFMARGGPDVPVVTFGQENSGADVFPLEVQLTLFETDLLVRTPKGNVEISSGLLGRHNVYNILAAVAVGIAVGVPLEDIVRGIEEVDAVPGRCELIDEEQAFAVVVDYAHTPDALSRLLDTIRECGPRRIITVVGCGGDRDRGKRPMMAKIASDKSDVTIITSDNPRTEDPLDIIDDMLAGVGWSVEEYCEWGEKDYYPPLPNGHRLFVYDIRCIAVRAAVAMGEEGDAVVIAGKGHETYQIVGKEKQYFDDREECREALQHVDALHAAGVDTSEFPWRVLESV